MVLTGEKKIGGFDRDHPGLRLKGHTGRSAEGWDPGEVRGWGYQRPYIRKMMHSALNL